MGGGAMFDANTHESGLVHALNTFAGPDPRALWNVNGTLLALRAGEVVLSPRLPEVVTALQDAPALLPRGCPIPFNELVALQEAPSWPGTIRRLDHEEARLELPAALYQWRAVGWTRDEFVIHPAQGARHLRRYRHDGGLIYARAGK